MGFCSRFFITLLAVCATKGAWANCVCDDGVCGVNEYCKRIVEIDHGHAVSSSTECTPCPTGSIPTNACNLCEVSNVCDGYDDPCPFGETPGKKCKKIGNCPTPCQLYERCDTANGATEQQMSGACHMENNTCYSNTRACSMFVVDHFAVGWNCDQGAQVGYAEWRPSENAWNTENCTCSVVDRDIVHDVGGVAAYGHCIAANSDFYVTDADKYRTASVNDHVRYSFRRRFCRQCEPGYLPTPWPSPDDGIILRPENTSGNWGVITCGIQVQAPDYAPGCVIDFGLSSGQAAYDDCRQECPTGFETDEPGATNINDCVAKYAPEFEDQTGRFVLTSLDSCP